MTDYPVVLYHYDGSPFATKIKNMLLLKRIPHKRVEVSSILPRPELSELLGVSYRRIPVLAIGNDVYCDTSLIASVLERRFPASKGYGTLFPLRKDGHQADTGLAKVLAMYWTDRALFPAVAGCLPYDKLGAEFLKDRSEMRGATIDVKAALSRQPALKSTVSSHLALLEEQLCDGRDWLLDTESPSLADLSAHFVVSWIPIFKFMRDLFDVQAFPKTLVWVSRTSKYLDNMQKTNAATFEKLSGEKAAMLICAGPHEDHETVGFNEVEAGRLNVKLGEIVSIAPDDNGIVPTVGKLVALNREEVAIETYGTSGHVRCHFPRLNFLVSKPPQFVRHAKL